jgi:hypothetical protein
MSTLDDNDILETGTSAEVPGDVDADDQDTDTDDTDTDDTDTDADDTDTDDA